MKDKIIFLLTAILLLANSVEATVIFKETPDVGCCKASYSDTKMSCKTLEDCKNKYPPYLDFFCDKTKEHCSSSSCDNQSIPSGIKGGCVYTLTKCENNRCVYELSQNNCQKPIADCSKPSDENKECRVKDEKGNRVCGACIRTNQEERKWYQLNAPELTLACTPNQAPYLKKAIVFKMKDGSLKALTREEVHSLPYIPLSSSAEYDFTNAESVFINQLNIDNHIFYQNYNKGLKVIVYDNKKSPPPEGDREETPVSELECEWTIKKVNNQQPEETLWKNVKGQCSDLQWSPGVRNDVLPLSVLGEMKITDNGKVIGPTCQGANKKSILVDKSFVICPAEVEYKASIFTETDILSDIEVPAWWNFLGLSRIDFFLGSPNLKTELSFDMGKVTYSSPGDDIPKEMKIKEVTEGHFYYLKGRKKIERQPILDARQKINNNLVDIHNAFNNFPYSNEEIKEIIYNNIQPHDYGKSPWIKDEIEIIFKDNFDIKATETITISEFGKLSTKINLPRKGEGNIIDSLVIKNIPDIESSLLDDVLKMKIPKLREEIIRKSGNQIRGVYLAAIMNKVLCEIQYTTAEDLAKDLSRKGNLFSMSHSPDGTDIIKSVWVDISTETGNRGDRMQLQIKANIDKGEIERMKKLTEMCRDSKYFSEDYVVPYLKEIRQCNPKKIIEEEEWINYWKDKIKLIQST